MPSLRRPLPAILAGKVKASDEEKFAAVVERYELKGLLREMEAAPLSTAKTMRAQVFWCRLALALMAEFFPVYRPLSANLQDWLNAGGSIFGAPSTRDEFKRFYQAQLIDAIERKRTEKKRSRSREWVFQWFANEKVIATDEAEARARLELLPKAYRLRKSHSIRQAFYTIPTSVRDRYRDFLPKSRGRKPEFLSATCYLTRTPLCMKHREPHLRAVPRRCGNSLAQEMR
jgi:hypothetical protein